MSVHLAGLGDIFDEWGISSDFLGGLEKIEATWQGREVVILSGAGEAGEIFQQQQIAFAIVQELLQKDAMIHALSDREVAHLLPIEAVFPDLEEEIAFAPRCGADPSKQFMLADVDLQNKALSCGLRKFWKKHKTAIIITAVVVVVAVGVTVAVVLLAPTAGSAIAGAGGAALTSLANSDSPHETPSSNNSHPSPGNSPSPSFEKLEPPKNSYGHTFTPTTPPVDVHSAPPSSQFSYQQFQPFSPYSSLENKAPLPSTAFSLNNQQPKATEFCQEFQDIALQNNFLIPSATNNNSKPSETSQQTPPVKSWDEKSWGEKTVDIGSHLVHKTFDEVTDLIKLVPSLCEEINDLSSKVLPEGFSAQDLLDNKGPVETFENGVARGHEVIDQIFSTDQAGLHTPEARANHPMNQFSFGILPPPGGGLGTTRSGIASLEGAWQKELSYLKLPTQESIKLFDEAAEKLKPFHGKYMPEWEIRELIHNTGIPTFPKPVGIPENFKIKLSDKAGGIKYVHPQDEGTYVRVMPGKAHSQNPRQQKPYVNQRINGNSVDKHGNIVSNKSEEAHIPLEEFVYREKGKISYAQ